MFYVTHITMLLYIHVNNFEIQTLYNKILYIHVNNFENQTLYNKISYHILKHISKSLIHVKYLYIEGHKIVISLKIVLPLIGCLWADDHINSYDFNFW